MHGPVSDFTPSGLTDLLGEISAVLRSQDGQPPDATAQAVLSGYAAQLSLLAAAKRSSSGMPRAMRSQLTFLAYGLQILAGEVPGHYQGDLTKDLREVTHLLVACRRDAGKLNRRVV
jgi:hypothetical protein